MENDSVELTLQQAAANIDAAHLAAFLTDISASFESMEEVQLLQFADYFDCAFTHVPASEFSWLYMFRESPISAVVDVPLSHLPQPTYTTSVDWINQRSNEALESFVLGALDTILDDVATQLGHEGGLRTSKSQVGVFLALAMVLRQKPDVLINVLLWRMEKYQRQDEFLLIVWMIVQVCHGDLCVGFYLFARHILPLVEQNSGSNPQTRDLIVQLIEWFFNRPYSGKILLEGTVRNGERLMPPSALDILLRAGFPASFVQDDATIMFRGAYPVLKEIALEGSPGTPEAMNQVTEELLPLALKAVEKDNPRLSREATMLCNWCLVKNANCYKIWDMIYVDNIEASVAVLDELVREWDFLSEIQCSIEALTETLKSFRQKNEMSLASGVDAPRAQFREADRYCRTLLSRLSCGHWSLKGIVVPLAVALERIIESYLKFDGDGNSYGMEKMKRS